MGSVGRIEKLNKLKKQNHKNCLNRRPGTSASLLWSLQITRHEPKINMAEKLIEQYSVQRVPDLVPVFLFAVTMLTFQIKTII